MTATTDIQVLKGWPKSQKPVSSAQVASALGLTVFQITARLKNMENRGYLSRDVKGNWQVTPSGEAEAKNPSPSVSGASKKMRAMDAMGLRSGPPQDAQVPRIRIKKEEWAPSDEALREAQQRLPVVQARLAEFLTSQRPNHHILALQVEKEHCLGIIKAKRKGCWTKRLFKTPSGNVLDIYVAPDMREYVHASPFETADLLIETMVPGIPPARLRLFATSDAAKKAKRELNRKVRREEAAKQEIRNQRILEEERASQERVVKENGGTKRTAGKKPAVRGKDRSEPEEERAAAESAFYALTPKQRDKIREEWGGKGASYVDWYRSTQTGARARGDQSREAGSERRTEVDRPRKRTRPDQAAGRDQAQRQGRGADVAKVQPPSHSRNGKRDSRQVGRDRAEHGRDGRSQAGSRRHDPARESGRRTARPPARKR